MTAQNRSYRMRRRAETQAETRQRIVDAAIALHQTIGPKLTTITDVAERAGVGRVTVYRHFPNELALSRACSGHYFATHPAPDPTEWFADRDPGRRVRAALTALYAYHRANEAMFRHVLADARDHPVMQPYHRYFEEAAAGLAAGFGLRGRAAQSQKAAIALAVSFDAWDRLARGGGLTEEEAVAVAMRLVRECGEGKVRPTRFSPDGAAGAGRMDAPDRAVRGRSR